MRKVTIPIILFFCFSSLAFGYTPTAKDKTQINKLHTALDTIYYKNPSKSEKLLSQIKIIANSYEWNERISYLLWELESYLEFQLERSIWKNTRVIDWDTIEVTISGVKEKVRLIGIDTPETEVWEEFYGKEATEYLKTRIGWKDVYIETDKTQGERDKYDRLLGYVFLSTENIGATMIKGGYAYEYTYDKAYKYQELYKSSETYASDNNLGLWDIPDTQVEEINEAKELIDWTKIYTPGKSYYDPNDESYLDMGFDCNKRKYCSYMNSCNEVKYFFYVCWAKTFDRDKDWIPCESICWQE